MIPFSQQIKIEDGVCMKKPVICILGCGNMGGAITRGIVEKNVFLPSNVVIYDVDAEKSANLSQNLGIKTLGLEEAVTCADLVLIAVKPQDANSLLSDIVTHIKSKTVISVMAGVKIDFIKNVLGDNVPVIRAMPNIAALIGEGITAIALNGKVEHIETIKTIFSGIGEVVQVEEKLMDSVTAVSGSGPAYLFYFANVMIETASELGLKRKDAEQLVMKTLSGSARFLMQENTDPLDLIRKVASKGGTTEAALSVFDENNLPTIINKAMIKARDRSEELSRR